MSEKGMLSMVLQLFLHLGDRGRALVHLSESRDDFYAVLHGFIFSRVGDALPVLPTFPGCGNSMGDISLHPLLWE